MNEGCQIRRAEDRDIPGILHLLVQVNMVHHTIRPDLFNGPATKYTAEELKAIIPDDKTPIFVCVDKEGRVLGHCFCVFQQHAGDNILTDIKTLYIDDLCVDENQRGKHVGKALYDYVLDFARASGCYNVTLNVWAGNDSALKFYQRQGLAMQKYGMEKIL
ncbi:MAG: GNAT family N-acetyltransferase [Clostridia bacterium]|nr:GNAT family N-acetyltransferase [Clostridia bacterium]